MTEAHVQQPDGRLQWWTCEPCPVPVGVTPWHAVVAVVEMRHLSTTEQQSYSITAYLATTACTASLDQRRSRCVQQLLPWLFVSRLSRGCCPAAVAMVEWLSHSMHGPIGHVATMKADRAATTLHHGLPCNDGLYSLTRQTTVEVCPAACWCHVCAVSGVAIVEWHGWAYRLRGNHEG